MPQFQGQAFSTLNAKERARANRPQLAERNMQAVTDMVERHAAELAGQSRARRSSYIALTTTCRRAPTSASRSVRSLVKITVGAISIASATTARRWSTMSRCRRATGRQVAPLKARAVEVDQSAQAPDSTGPRTDPIHGGFRRWLQLAPQLLHPLATRPQYGCGSERCRD